MKNIFSYSKFIHYNNLQNFRLLTNNKLNPMSRIYQKNTLQKNILEKNTLQKKEIINSQEKNKKIEMHESHSCKPYIINKANMHC